MGIIVGSLTNVVIDGKSDGIQSISWATQLSNNRLWELGNWSPYKTQVSAIITVSVTTYAGVLSPIALNPTQSCSDSDATKDVTIVADACGAGSSVNINETGMYVTSYSYSKSDPNAFGTESWTFQKWIDSNPLLPNNTDYIGVVAPTFVLQGISEGSYKTDPGLDVGVVLTDTVTSSEGNVSAGALSLGRIDDNVTGIVTRIGGGDLVNSGKVGSSNASIPHTPLYI